MPYEVINSVNAKTTIRVVGTGNTLIKLSDLKKTVSENVVGASIVSVSSVSDGIWKIYRGDNASGTILLELPNSTNLKLYESGISLSNNSTANIYITNSGTVGSLLLQVSKSSTYSTDIGAL